MKLARLVPTLTLSDGPGACMSSADGRSRPIFASHTKNRSNSEATMLPSWMTRGRAVAIPITNKRAIHLPPLPTTVLLLIAGYFLGATLLSTGVATWQPAKRPHANPPFLVPSEQFLPPPPKPASVSHYPEPLSVKERDMVVPNSLHYIYGLKPVPEGKEPDELPYYAYLAIRSAIINLEPEKIYFHYKHLPTGPWFAELMPYLTLIEAVVPDQVFGRPVEHFAHKADVLRLEALKYSGGIYLDIDIFVVRPFTPLMYHPTTLGMEAATDSRKSDLDPTGLCNAIIIAQPQAPFIERWLASYSTFNEQEWASHSVEKPWELARVHRNEIQVLNTRAFFWPHWKGEEVQYVHERNDHDFIKTGQFAYHAWESLAMKYLRVLSPASIRATDTSFHRLVRPFIGPRDDAIYEQWSGKQT